MKIEGGLDVQPARFVLLRHTLPPESPRKSHWDLMFELKTGLLTLELQELPPDSALDQARAMPAIRLPDHRLHYLDFAGEVSGNRGMIVRIAAGTYRQAAALAHENRRRFSLSSDQLRAELEFEIGEPGEPILISVRRWKLDL